MKLKEGTYIVKKEDWEEFYKRAYKKCESDTIFLLPEYAKEDLIAYIGTSRFGWYGYDLDTEEIRERCNNRGLTLIEYIPKPKKPKELKLTLEEVMEDIVGCGEALHAASCEGDYNWHEEESSPLQFKRMKTLFRKVIIRYLEEVYKDKEGTSIN